MALWGAHPCGVRPLLCAVCAGRKDGYRPPPPTPCSRPSFTPAISGHRCVCQRPDGCSRKRFGAECCFGANGAKPRCSAPDQVYQRRKGRCLPRDDVDRKSTPKRVGNETAFSRSARTPPCCVRCGWLTCPCSVCRTAATHRDVPERRHHPKAVALSKRNFAYLCARGCRAGLAGCEFAGGAYNFGSEADVSMWLGAALMEKQAWKLNWRKSPAAKPSGWCAKLKSCGGGFETTAEPTASRI